MDLFRSARVFARTARPDDVLRKEGRPVDMSVESLLDSVLDHSSLILWAVDLEGTFTLSRGAGLRELGLDDGQVVGQNCFDLYASFPSIQQSIRSGLLGNEHRDIVEVNGSIFESWYCPVRNEDDEIQGLVGISSAVTELAKSRQDFYDATAHFHLAFQESPVVMMILKAAGGAFVDANQSFEKVTGFSRQAVAGRTGDELGLWNTRDFFPPVDEPWSEFESFNDRMIHAVSKAGTPLILVAAAAQIKFEDQPCLLVFARDATSETKTARELEKSERRFSTLAKQAPVGIFQCNQAGEIVYANDYFWRGVGQPDRLARGIQPEQPHWFEFFQTNSEALKQDWQNAASLNVSFRRELRVESGPEAFEWGLLQIDEFSEEEGQFLGSLADITAMKQTESASALQRRELEKAVRQRTDAVERAIAELRHEVQQRTEIAQQLKISQEEMQAVVNNAVDFILRVNCEGRIVYINRVAEGLTRDQVINSHALDWVRGEYVEPMVEHLTRLLEDGVELSFEAPLHYPNGDVRICAMKGAAIKVDGEIIGASIVARDITRERNLEKEARRRLEELSHIARLSIVGEMSATMSHELKQPLLAIGNYASGCLSRLDDGTYTTADVVKHLQTINRLSEQGCQILRRTRDFVSNRPFDPKPTSIKTVIDNSLEFVQSEAKTRQVEIGVECEKDLPESCLDGIQIQQVVINLLMNALEAIQESVKTTPHRITLRAFRSNGEWVTLLIQDTADGIPEDFMEAMFDAFQTRKQNGLGMGLAISRGIIENHGGTLKVKYTGPEGTIFQMRLPSCS